MTIILLQFAVFRSIRVVSGQNSCTPGLPGPGCTVCTTDSQCAKESGNDLALCSTDFAFANTSTIKGYQCDASGPDLIKTLLKPDSIIVQCFTGLVAGEQGNAGVAETQDSQHGLFGKRKLLQDATEKTCAISFTVKNPEVRVDCRATECSMTPGGMNVGCSHVQCTCADNGSCNNDLLIQNLVKSANKQLSWECSKEGVCVLGLEGFVVPRIEAMCVTGECLVPTQNALKEENITLVLPEQGSPVENLSWNWSIAAIPTFVLVIIISLVGFYSYQMREYWRPVFSCIQPSNGLRMQSKSQIESFEFQDLAVYVPMDERVAEHKRESLRGKALVRHGTMHVFTSMNTGVTHSLVKNAKKRLGIKTSDDVEVPEEFASQTRPNKQLDAANQVVSLHNGRTKGEWCILKDCSGSFSPGEVVGILGPSGCGKTTLLSSITGSALDLGKSTVLQGEILINGKRREAHQVAYVPQADNLIPTLTVRECVKYSALLRLPREMSPEEINSRVENVLRELGIEHIGDSQVGGSGRIRGVSGGERRRVTIAMELVTDPSIIVLDEPTSGLDSYTAMTLLKCLRQVAKGNGGRVVIASLHQPSKDMYYGLDTVILMGHGRILYMGNPEEAGEYMQAAGVPGPSNTPTAEHMLQVASNPLSVVAMLNMNKVARSSAVKNTSVGSPTKPSVRVSFDGKLDIASVMTPSGESSPTTGDDFLDVDTESRLEANSSLRRELSVMFWRTLVDIIRNPTLLFLHVALATCTGVVTGAIFYDLESNSIGVQNRMGGTFFALAFLAFTSLTTVDLLMNERTVVLREVRSRFYRPSSYLISKIALDGLLLRVLPAILYWLPFYYMAGFQDGGYYAATYLFTLIAFNCAVGAMSMCVTIACNTAGQTSFIMNFILLFSLAFTGFLVNVSSIPAVLRWIHYLSVFFYAFEAMISTELAGMSFTFLYQSGPTSETLEIQDITGETFLTTLGFDVNNVTRDIGVLVGVYYGLCGLALVFFLLRLPRTESLAKVLSTSCRSASATCWQGCRALLPKKEPNK